jgi:nifR3 family TIM-barrel protein
MTSIGSVKLDNPFVLAPMAGIGDAPYRRLCRKGGAGMVCAEMVSSNALFFGDERSRRMLEVFPDEHPVSMQVFGSEPERLAHAARLAEEAGADIVDLNCGCPVPKIAKTGAGISLMREESLFSKCVAAMSRAVKVPVTVKMRLGFVKGQNRAARFAKLAEEAGAAAVSVHARSMEDRHSGPPAIDLLAEAVASVKVPVFGNGGINTYSDARSMMDRSGCAGVLIGQAAVGNPLLFMEFLKEQINVVGDQWPVAGKGLGRPPTTDHRSRFHLLREHARMIVEHYGEGVGIRRLRKYLASYIRDLPRAAEFRGRAVAAGTLDELMTLVDDYEKSLT